MVIDSDEENYIRRHQSDSLKQNSSHYVAHCGSSRRSSASDTSEFWDAVEMLDDLGVSTPFDIGVIG